MMTVAKDRVARIRQEKRRVFRFQVVGLSRFPEVVPYHQAVLVCQRIEIFFCILAHPIANHIYMRVAMQTEIWLEMSNAHALQHVVHSPVAAARSDANAIHLDHQVSSRPASVDWMDR